MTCAGRAASGDTVKALIAAQGNDGLTLRSNGESMMLFGSRVTPDANDFTPMTASEYDPLTVAM